jgi:hypothetical protein
MRILPDNPSVDFLRREAKDLLAALRETTPTSSLSDAQQALSAHYGFRAWTDLKAEVDRRRADVPAAPTGLAEQLAEVFGLGTLTRPPTPVAFDPMGRTWCLETERGRWSAGPVYPWIDGSQAERGMRLLTAAREVGVASPTPVRSPAGRLIEKVDGESWRVDEWLDLGPIPMQPVRASVAGKVGEITGALHGLAIPSDVAINPYLTHRRPTSDWTELLERARAARKPWAEDLFRLLPAIEALSAIAPDPATAPLLLCNCILNPESVRSGRGDELVVVEWLFAGSLTPELEVASLLVAWFVRPELNVVGIQSFVEGYARAAGGFPTLEPASFTVAIAGWLNWSHSQICEAIDPADADRAAFANREAVDVISDPLTPARIEQLLDAVTAALSTV